MASRTTRRPTFPFPSCRFARLPLCTLPVLFPSHKRHSLFELSPSFLLRARLNAAPWSPPNLLIEPKRRDLPRHVLALLVCCHSSCLCVHSRASEGTDAAQSFGRVTVVSLRSPPSHCTRTSVSFSCSFFFFFPSAIGKPTIARVQVRPHPLQCDGMPCCEADAAIVRRHCPSVGGAAERSVGTIGWLAAAVVRSTHSDRWPTTSAGRSIVDDKRAWG